MRSHSQSRQLSRTVARYEPLESFAGGIRATGRRTNQYTQSAWELCRVSTTCTDNEEHVDNVLYTSWLKLSYPPRDCPVWQGIVPNSFYQLLVTFSGSSPTENCYFDVRALLNTGYIQLARRKIQISFEDAGITGPSCLPSSTFSFFLTKKRGSYKGYTGARYKSAIAATCRTGSELSCSVVVVLRVIFSALEACWVGSPVAGCKLVGCSRQSNATRRQRACLGTQMAALVRNVLLLHCTLWAMEASHATAPPPPLATYYHTSLGAPLSCVYRVLLKVACNFRDLHIPVVKQKGLRELISKSTTTTCTNDDTNKWYKSGSSPALPAPGVKYNCFIAEMLVPPAGPYPQGQPGALYIATVLCATPYVMGVVRRFINYHYSTLLPWPVLLPDLSPIENGRGLAYHSRTLAATKYELWARIEAAWAEIPQTDIQSLFLSMPRLAAVVIAVRVGATQFCVHYQAARATPSMHDGYSVYSAWYRNMCRGMYRDGAQRLKGGIRSLILRQFLVKLVLLGIPVCHRYCTNSSRATVITIVFMKTILRHEFYSNLEKEQYYCIVTKQLPVRVPCARHAVFTIDVDDDPVDVDMLDEEMPNARRRKIYNSNTSILKARPQPTNKIALPKTCLKMRLWIPPYVVCCCLPHCESKTTASPTECEKFLQLNNLRPDRFFILGQYD
ncbi:hypothetical protein PR048_020814 [Dryococelus australis]|uniref:Uncharacterized protein n=1 Tax=Dryococelus australis TaxID=614101 RepID=A0ABQ9GWK1_9NEOP|nr:hypothetical protein PR048_020814 [Dryococelus australis]